MQNSELFFSHAWYQRTSPGAGYGESYLLALDEGPPLSMRIVIDESDGSRPPYAGMLIPYEDQLVRLTTLYGIEVIGETSVPVSPYGSELPPLVEFGNLDPVLFAGELLVFVTESYLSGFCCPDSRGLSAIWAYNGIDFGPVGDNDLSEIGYSGYYTVFDEKLFFISYDLDSTEPHMPPDYNIYVMDKDYEISVFASDVVRSLIEWGESVSVPNGFLLYLQYDGDAIKLMQVLPGSDTAQPFPVFFEGSPAVIPESARFLSADDRLYVISDTLSAGTGPLWQIYDDGSLIPIDIPGLSPDSTFRLLASAGEQTLMSVNREMVFLLTPGRAELILDLSSRPEMINIVEGRFTDTETIVLSVRYPDESSGQQAEIWVIDDETEKRISVGHDWYTTFEFEDSLHFVNQEETVFRLENNELIERFNFSDLAPFGPEGDHPPVFYTGFVEFDVEQDNPVFRFFDPGSNTHFLTASRPEKIWVRDNLSSWVYEEIAFRAADSQDMSADPVHRFFNPVSGDHFLTQSGEEKDFIMQILPDFIYEGIALYAYAEQEDGSDPVYRFYDETNNSHFYTVSKAERDSAEHLNMTYEGIAFYADPFVEFG